LCRLPASGARGRRCPFQNTRDRCAGCS
jgi:hypothetical protein